MARDSPATSLLLLLLLRGQEGGRPSSTSTHLLSRTKSSPCWATALPEEARKEERRREKSTSQKTRKRRGTASWLHRDTPSASSRYTSMACGAAQLSGEGAALSCPVQGDEGSRWAGDGHLGGSAAPPYLHDLAAGGGSQLEGDEEVGAEHVEHLRAAADGGEGVGQGQRLEGDAAQPGQHGQQRGGEQPGLPGPHQERAERADTELGCGGDGEGQHPHPTAPRPCSPPTPQHPDPAAP